ncbi:MAG: helix-turn-helix domain-containing protein [Pyrinomonadaceae bacterium]|jgi:excisionase family DNA binding protein|nr:helix-turn-helix domain-containing protein [Pyrinomonadaceae bacterium]
MLLTTVELAQKVKLSRPRISQLISNQIIKAEKIGRDWVIDESQIRVIKNLPDGRGKYNRNKVKEDNFESNNIS